MRVLVADDHALVRDGISSLLEAAGFSVIGQVGDGLEALEALDRLQPDLVLMDISMPGMDGLEALGRIKEKYPQVKVVMLTVSEEDEDLFAALRGGADGYLLKSLDATSFMESLRRLEQGDKAVFAAYGEALKLNPKHKAAHEYIGEAYLMAGKVDKAEQHLAELQRLCTPIPCEELKQLSRAVEDYKKSKK